jgi:hypothetical protein
VIWYPSLDVAAISARYANIDEIARKVHDEVPYGPFLITVARLSVIAFSSIINDLTLAAILRWDSHRVVLRIDA